MQSKKNTVGVIPEKYLRVISNRYFLVVLVLLIWVTFFDRYNFVDRFRTNNKIKNLEKERDYYVTEVNKNKTLMNNLFTNKDNLEKFAREKYNMKRDSEDVFVIVREENKIAN